MILGNKSCYWNVRIFEKSIWKFRKHIELYELPSVPTFEWNLGLVRDYTLEIAQLDKQLHWSINESTYVWLG